MPFRVPLFFKIRPNIKWRNFHKKRQSIIGILDQKSTAILSSLTFGIIYIIALVIQYN
jgi:hypothetical protein